MKNNKIELIKIWGSMLLVLLIYVILTIIIDTYIKNVLLTNTLMTILTIIFLTLILIILKKELKVCSYECKNCKQIFKPEYKKLIYSPHIGLKKYLKCPKCNKRNWNRKVIDK